MLKKFFYVPRFFFAAESAKSVPGKTFNLYKAINHQPLLILLLVDMLVHYSQQHLKTKL
jgi:hypothetical protein